MRHILLVATATLAIAGCARNREAAQTAGSTPADAATTATDPATDGTGAADGTVGTADVAASRADFIARAGSDVIYFNTDRHDLDDPGRATLDAQAAWLSANPAVRVTLEGHADERGTREYNIALGERRANAVRDYLTARGISATRMEVVSYGRERPVAVGSDEGAWAQNRRAVTILPTS